MPGNNAAAFHRDTRNRFVASPAHLFFIYGMNSAFLYYIVMRIQYQRCAIKVRPIKVRFKTFCLRGDEYNRQCALRGAMEYGSQTDRND